MDAPEALVAITPFNFKRIAAMFPPLSSASAEVFRFAPALAVTVDDDWVPVLTARLPSALRWSKIGVPSAFTPAIWLKVSGCLSCWLPLLAVVMAVAEPSHERDGIKPARMRLRIAFLVFMVFWERLKAKG